MQLSRQECTLATARLSPHGSIPKLSNELLTLWRTHYANTLTTLSQQDQLIYLSWWSSLTKVCIIYHASCWWGGQTASCWCGGQTASCWCGGQTRSIKHRVHTKKKKKYVWYFHVAELKFIWRCSNILILCKNFSRGILLRWQKYWTESVAQRFHISNLRSL